MRIVIVEDEAPIREGLGKILKKISPDYILAGEAKDGKEGLALIEEVRPDLVILDIQMPDMDGLTMLREVRRLQIPCRAVVLTAYSDFTYAKEAIELGIDNYLLKPVKIPELKETLHQTEEKLEEFRGESVSLEEVFTCALLDRPLPHTKNGLEKGEMVGLFLLYIIPPMRSCWDTARRLLEDLKNHSLNFDAAIVERKDRGEIAAVLYHMRDPGKLKRFFKRSVVPMINGNLGEAGICCWNSCQGIEGLRSALEESRRALDWSLVLEKGGMLDAEDIAQKKHTISFQYPIDLEAQVRTSVLKRDWQIFEKSFGALEDLCKRELYQPGDIKEVCISYCWKVLNTAKECMNLKPGSVPTQELLQSISQACSWKEIHLVLAGLFQKVVPKDMEASNGNVSILIQKATKLIKEHYSQGVTLEEIAAKLNVSEEYLSTQFRKETGMSFTETIRDCRMKKVKKLLIGSNLKLNQIAAMVGYSDPKYMSKVFKEETGMLPAEYRKINS